MSLEAALQADAKGSLELAAEEYEEALSEGGASLETLLNFAVLCWQATDPGRAAAERFSAELLDHFERRSRELLAGAERDFATSTEPRFWRRYIAWADLGEPLSRNFCWDLLAEEPSTLVPAMYLFSASGGAEAEREARELLAQCRETQTERARYVRSVIESTLSLVSRGRLRS